MTCRHQSQPRLRRSRRLRTTLLAPASSHSRQFLSVIPPPTCKWPGGEVVSWPSAQDGPGRTFPCSQSFPCRVIVPRPKLDDVSALETVSLVQLGVIGRRMTVAVRVSRK